jgi:Lipase maturation factor/Bacterial regulatory proteins, luxR family
MWFAALSPGYAEPWFLPLVAKLLQNDPATLRLLRRVPFPPNSAGVHPRPLLRVPLHDVARTAGDGRVVEANPGRRLPTANVTSRRRRRTLGCAHPRPLTSRPASGRLDRPCLPQDPACLAGVPPVTTSYRLASSRPTPAGPPPGPRVQLDVACRLEGSFSVEDVARVLGQPAGHLLPALWEALDAGVIVPGDDRLAFRCELCRQAVAAAMPEPVRQALDQQVRAMRPNRGTAMVWRPAAASPLAPGRPAGARLGQSDRHRAQGGHDRRRGTHQPEVAQRMFLSPHTVDFDLRQIFRKLDIRSRVELTRLMLECPQEAGHDAPEAVRIA